MRNLKTRVRFPNSLTPAQEEFKADLLRIFSEEDKLPAQMVYNAIERIVLDMKILEDMIIVESLSDAQATTKSDKIAHLFTTTWLTEHNDKLVHFLCMLQNNPKLMQNLSKPGLSAEERLKLFLKAAGNRINKWANVAYAIKLIKPVSAKKNIKAGVWEDGLSEEEYNEQIKNAYMTLLYEIVIMSDTCQYWYSKDLLEKYYLNMCKVAGIDRQSIKPDSLCGIFEEDGAAVTIESILESIRTSFNAEVDKKRRCLQEGKKYDIEPVMKRLIVHLKSILDNWDGIIQAEKALKKFFMCKHLWPAIMNLDSNDTHSLNLLHKKAVMYLEHHNPNRSSEILAENPEISENVYINTYLYGLYINMWGVLQEKAAVLREVNKVEFSSEFDFALAQKDAELVEEYVIEESCRPFQAQLNSSVESLSASTRELFVITDEVIQEFAQMELESIFKEPGIEPASEKDASVSVSPQVMPNTVETMIEHSFPSKITEDESETVKSCSSVPEESKEESNNKLDQSNGEERSHTTTCRLNGSLSEKEDLDAVHMAEAQEKENSDSELLNHVNEREENNPNICENHLNRRKRPLNIGMWARITMYDFSYYDLLHTFFFCALISLQLGMFLYSIKVTSDVVPNILNSYSQNRHSILKNLYAVYYLSIFGAIASIIIHVTVIFDMFNRLYTLDKRSIMFVTGLAAQLLIVCILGLYLPTRFSMFKLDSYLYWLVSNVLLFLVFFVYSICTTDRSLKCIVEKKNRRIIKCMLIAIGTFSASAFIFLGFLYKEQVNVLVW